MLRRLLLPPLALFATAVVAAGCGDTTSASGGGSGELTLVAYSTPQEAYEEIIPAFQKTGAGKGVTFDQSYGASGDQAPRRGGRPARRRRGALARARREQAREGRPVDDDWKADELRGPRHAARWWSSPCARATPRTSRPGTT